MSDHVGAGAPILLCGLPASGKTTLAERPERERPAMRFPEDERVARMFPPRAIHDDEVRKRI